MSVGCTCLQVAPWSKTGGLGDVCGSLPPALAARGHRVMVVAPRYAEYDVTPVDQVMFSGPLRPSDLLSGSLMSRHNCGEGEANGASRKCVFSVCRVRRSELLAMVLR